MSNSRLDHRTHSAAVDLDKEDLEAFLVSRASTTSLDKEDRELAILSETFSKSSKSFSADSKDKGGVEELKHK